MIGANSVTESVDPYDSAVAAAAACQRTRVVAVWDTSRGPVTLGGLLLLLQELAMLGQYVGATRGELCFLGVPEGEIAFPPEGWFELSEGTGPHHPLIELALSSAVPDACFLCRDREGLAALAASAEPALLWPDYSCDVTAGYGYGTTLYVQRLYARMNRLPFLAWRGEGVAWADSLLKQRVWPRVPIASHLRNGPAIEGPGKANLEAWETFFKAVANSYDVCFVLVGSDDLPPRFEALPNVVIANNHGGSPARDMALIHRSAAFMGTASGPCQAAMFGGKPYAIFKHPDHHADEMREELGDADRHSFAGEGQSFLRVLETPDLLMSAWEDMQKFLCQDKARAQERR